MKHLSQNVWSAYGLKDNPYIVKPLSKDSEKLPIESAFVGRDQSPETKIITNIFRNPGGNCLTIEGEVGVGKTTFLNYHKYLWEYKAVDKLFTPNYEIGISIEWDLKDFLRNILSAITSKIFNLEKVKKSSIKKDFFKELRVLTSIYIKQHNNVNAGLNLGFCGAELGLDKNEIVMVPELSEAKLLEYFKRLVKEIKLLGFSGVILHFDNMEILAKAHPQKMIQIFENIRDTLQTPDVYFVFIGYPGFFNDVISPLERVRSIFFGYPILVEPLPLEEVLTLFETRYQILSKQGSYIKPVENQFIAYLYKLFEGKVRFVMDAMNTLIPNLNIAEARTLSAHEAKAELNKIISTRTAFLTRLEKDLLIEMASHKTFTNKSLSIKTGMKASNVARTIRKLKERNLINIDKQVGKYTYYKVNEEIRVITNSKGQNTYNSTSSVYFKEKRMIIETFGSNNFTRKELQRLLDIPTSSLCRLLSKLVASNILIRHGKGRSTSYSIKNNSSYLE